MDNQTNNETPQNDFAPQDTGFQPDSVSPDMNGQPGYGQPDMNDQPGYGQPDMNGQPGYGQPNMNNQPGYGQPNMNNQPGFDQPPMNGQVYGQPNMNGQMGYGQPGMNGQPGYGQPGMSAQNGYYQQNAGAGNGYYQAPGGNGYYQNQQPPQKKANGGVIALVVGVVLLIVLILVGIVLLAVAANRYSEDNKDKDSSVTADDYDDYDDWSGYDDYDDDDDYDSYGSGSADTYDPLAFLDDVDWDDEDWMDEPENHTPDEVGRNGVYYELANCIDRDVSYAITHENFEELDRDNNICIRINYYQLEGDIPNIDKLNEALEEFALYYDTYFNDHYDDYMEMFEDEGSGFVNTIETYITYNDESILSVVYDVYYETATTVDKCIVCLNLDLESGTIAYNTDFLDITDEFIEDYKDICIDQNGYISALSYFDDDELRDYFEDEDELILYYTPFGLEVGFNYETETSYGWVTATIADYEQYLKSY
ncbi:MAG: hypothetical protein J1E61_09215 [Lachnospiraceae bacterium]|nr:hypothetical protein [Lachnospiraceae bacterium]